jgi:putative membrane protein
MKTTDTTWQRVAWCAVFFAVLIWSCVAPKDYYTWVLEVAPALIGFAILVYTRKIFPLTTLLYQLILLHSVILMVGGHYTYAEVPLFDWFAEVLGHQRNNYDKVGHLAQGFVPAIIAREVMLRKAIVRGRGWLNFLIIAICLGFSAFYELIEWWVALLAGSGAEDFLGTQGYIWDTQSDMGMALIGAIAALLFLGKLHDRQLNCLK